MNSQGRQTAMLIKLIRGYAKQLQEIQARKITTKKLQGNVGEEQEEELTGFCTAAAEQQQACNKGAISLSNALVVKKSGGGVEEEAEAR
jgi:hypothetical protein